MFEKLVANFFVTVSVFPFFKFWQVRKHMRKNRRTIKIFFNFSIEKLT